MTEYDRQRKLLRQIQTDRQTVRHGRGAGGPLREDAGPVDRGDDALGARARRAEADAPVRGVARPLQGDLRGH